MITRNTTRRFVCAGLFAAVVTSAPIVAGLAMAPQALAGPGTCTTNQTGNSSSMVCSPNISTGGLHAPTQQEITAKNAWRTHMRGGF